MPFDLLVATLIFSSAQPAQIGPPVPVTRAAPVRECRDEPAEGEPAEGEEIVVCGERYDENSPYRVPQQFRDQPSDDDAHASWDARWRDEEALGRFSDQMTGGSGYLQRSQQQRCEWLAARQQAQGRRPDCGRKPRPDAATDWQRR